MVILAYLALAAASSQTPPPVTIAAAERQAVAMVRILPGVPLRFAEIEQSAPEMLRDTRIPNSDGSTEPVRLIEFQ